MKQYFRITAAIIACILAVNAGEGANYTALLEQVKCSAVEIKTDDGRQGGGFFIDPDGRILTTHSLCGSAFRITVTTYSGETVEADILMGNYMTDIVLLKAKTSRPYPSLKLSTGTIASNEAIIPAGPIMVNLKGEVVGLITEDGMTSISAKTMLDFLNTPYAMKLAGTGTPETLRKAVQDGLNFNVSRGSIYDYEDDENDNGYYPLEYETPLHRAASLNYNAESIRFLIEQNIDVNADAVSGNTIRETPLSCAVHARNIGAVRELLKAGADPHVWSSGDNITMFHIVASEYRIYSDAKTVIDMLVEAGGNLDFRHEFTPKEKREVFDDKDPSGIRLMWSEDYPFGEDVYLLSHAGRGNYLSTLTPLIYAVFWDNPEVVNALLDAGADPGITSLEGKTAYDYAKTLSPNSELRKSTAFRKLQRASRLSRKK